MFIKLNINVSMEGRKRKKIVHHAIGDEWLLVLLPMETKYVSCDNTGALRVKLSSRLTQLIIIAWLQKIFLHITAYPRNIAQIEFSFPFICPVIGYEFSHNMVKVAVDPQSDSQVDLQTTLIYDKIHCQ